MEEEIDLREYINVLIRHWYWIVGLALVTAAVAFVVTSFQPPTYEATALVVATKPRYLFQFDERVENILFDPAQFSKGYLTIATSDDLLLSTVSAMDPPLSPERQSAKRLREMITAETGGDPSLIKLTVRSQDPEEAARLANVWAGQLVDQLDNVYGRKNNLPFFEAQTVEAKTTLEQADQALAAFRREYGLGFSDNTHSGEMTLDLGIARRLQDKTDLLMQYEAKADQIAPLLQEAQAVAEQVDDTTSPAIVAGLLADMLQLGLVKEEEEEEKTSLLVQISLGELDAETSLSALITALEAKQDSIDEAIVQLTAEVESLQAELADRQQELDQLLRDRQVAQDTYLTLSSKSQETYVETQQEAGGVRLLSHAAVPLEPVGPRRLLNTVVAGTLGLMVGVFGAFFIEYWRQEAPELAPTGEPSPERASAG